MKSNNRLLISTLLILLCLSLFTACKAETPSTPAQAPPEASPAAEPAKPAEKIQEQPQTGPVAASALEEAPAVPKPEAPPQDEAEPAKDANIEKSSIQIEGSGVEKAAAVTLDELKAMQDAFLEDDFFSLNSYGTKEYFHFKGVKLGAVLEKAGLKKTAATVVFVAVDGYRHEMTVEQALREDYIDEQNPDTKYPCIIAWHENGKDYDAEKGAPFRLVIGQKEPGDVNKPQWVQNIAKIIVD